MAILLRVGIGAKRNDSSTVPADHDFAVSGPKTIDNGFQGFVMAHFVTGLIARRGALQAFAASHQLPAPIALTEVLGLLPLDEDVLDTLLPEPPEDFVAGFNTLSPPLMAALKAGSQRATLLYFETEYFGGMGTQGAAVFRDGDVVFGPQAAELGPINNALAVLGVRTVPPAVDEFETVGLHRHRSTDEWFAAAADGGA